MDLWYFVPFTDIFQMTVGLQFANQISNHNYFSFHDTE